MNETSADEGKGPNAATTDEREASAGPRSLAVKNKRCPYCSQTFTSSSLGRHLDQYLYKKKPDGVHNVEQIKQLRSSITRRTARGGTKQGSPDSASASVPTSVPASVSAPVPTRLPDPHHAAPLLLNSKSAGGEKFRLLLNQPTWHSTGVINDIPNSLPVSQLRVASTSLEKPTRLTSAKSSSETTKALELALKEVLDSVKAASSNFNPSSSPFDFDFQSQTFPALCLQVLPHPPSLFSTHPFPSPNSFPIDSPTADQREIVQKALRAHVFRWKHDQLAAARSRAQAPSSASPSSPTPLIREADTIEKLAYQHEEMTLRHLELSLQHWMALSPGAQRELWHLEIVRAFARESEKRKSIEDQLHRTQQEANQLRAQVERLASCQWPREFAIFPPNLLPISPDVARELNAHDSKLISPESPAWDYDNLVAKWQRVVMHDRSMGRSGVGGLDNTNIDLSASSSSAMHQPYSTRIAPSLQQSSPQSHSLVTPAKHAQPYHQQRIIRPMSPSKHSPSHEGDDASKPTEYIRPSKRLRHEDQAAPQRLSPAGSSSPRPAWNHSPAHDPSATPRNRSNSVLSPALPRGPAFPINSAATTSEKSGVVRSAGSGDNTCRSHQPANIAGLAEGSASSEASPATQRSSRDSVTRDSR